MGSCSRQSAESSKLQQSELCTALGLEVDEVESSKSRCLLLANFVGSCEASVVLRTGRTCMLPVFYVRCSETLSASS